MSERQKQRRGFAAMSPEKRREIAAKGGANVPAHKRAFSRDRELASIAGSTGGSAPHASRPGRRGAGPKDAA